LINQLGKYLFCVITVVPDYVEYMASYRIAYNNLKRLDQSDENIRLIIGRYEPDGVIPFYVLGFEDECPKCFSLKFSPWEKWLGATVDDLILRQYERQKLSPSVSGTWRGRAFHRKMSLLSIKSLLTFQWDAGCIRIS